MMAVLFYTFHSQELLKLNWDEVSQVDKLTMTKNAIRKSQVKKRWVLLWVLWQAWWQVPNEGGCCCGCCCG